MGYRELQEDGIAMDRLRGGGGGGQLAQDRTGSDCCSAFEAKSNVNEVIQFLNIF